MNFVWNGPYLDKEFYITNDDQAPLMNLSNLQFSATFQFLIMLENWLWIFINSYSEITE